MIKKFNEFNKINEGAPNYELQSKIEKTQAYSSLSKKLKSAVDIFISELEEEIGYEEGDTDDDRAVGLAIQSAIDFHYGY